MKIKKIITLLLLLIILFPFLLYAQNKKPKTLEVIGYYFYSIGDFSEAIKEYKKALEIDPNNSKIHYNLGVIYAENHDYNSAIKELKEALNGDCSIKKDALYNLIIIYGKYLKNTDMANFYYEKFNQMKITE
ncbi:MAG: tetratricopeptide repeat protein [Candidatus Omnitrophica bacterium]|nr:tetratricopeptide repeat protein [Candidatus Omnitrophota bacterium]MCK5288734.1 tetratricopeptide repeat protein [Candidatus Omnitrophota bacterium]